MLLLLQAESGVWPSLPKGFSFPLPLTTSVFYRSACVCVGATYGTLTRGCTQGSTKGHRCTHLLLSSTFPLPNRMWEKQDHLGRRKWAPPPSQTGA